jgi:hypothetical protein
VRRHAFLSLSPPTVTFAQRQIPVSLLQPPDAQSGEMQQHYAVRTDEFDRLDLEFRELEDRDFRRIVH